MPTWQLSTNTADYKSDLTAFHVGPMVEYELPIFPLAIEAGLLYTQKGMDITKAGDEGPKLKSNLIDPCQPQGLCDELAWKDASSYWQGQASTLHSIPISVT